MDAEHRHELKTNELADWIGHFPDFCRQNAKTIIGVALIIAAAAVFLYGRHVRAKTRFEQEAQAISLIERLEVNKLTAIQNQRDNTTAAAGSLRLSADSLKMAAAEAKSSPVAALLLIKQGDALRADLHYRAEEVDADIVQNQIAQARQAYEEAIIRAGGNNTLVAMANFGLGLCAEEIGDYTKAEEIYNSIIANADFAGTVLPRQARERLDSMADNKMQFTFVDAPPPKPEDIKIDSATPEPVMQDTPKNDNGAAGVVEIKLAGEESASGVEPVIEEQDAPGPETAPTDPNAVGEGDSGTN